MDRLPVISYESHDNPNINHRWFAMLVSGGKPIYVLHYGQTRDEAISKAHKWREDEIERAKRDGFISRDDGQPKDQSSERASPTIRRDEPSNKSKSPLPSVAGSVWMINRSTNVRKRVNRSEVAGFEAAGFVLGKN